MQEFEKEMIKDKVTNSALGKIIGIVLIYCLFGGLAWLIGTLVWG